MAVALGKNGNHFIINGFAWHLVKFVVIFNKIRCGSFVLSGFLKKSCVGKVVHSICRMK